MEWVTKHLKWIVWGIIAVATTFLAVMFQGLRVESRTTQKKPKPKLPELPPKLKLKMQKVQEEALVTRVKAKAHEEVQLERLASIQQIDDGSERRKRLAEMMAEL